MRLSIRVSIIITGSTTQAASMLRIFRLLQEKSGVKQHIGVARVNDAWRLLRSNMEATNVQKGRS